MAQCGKKLFDLCSRIECGNADAHAADLRSVFYDDSIFFQQAFNQLQTAVRCPILQLNCRHARRVFPLRRAGDADPGYTAQAGSQLLSHRTTLLFNLVQSYSLRCLHTCARTDAQSIVLRTQLIQSPRRHQTAVGSAPGSCWQRKTKRIVVLFALVGNHQKSDPWRPHQPLVDRSTEKLGAYLLRIDPKHADRLRPVHQRLDPP